MVDIAYEIINVKKRRKFRAEDFLKLENLLKEKGNKMYDTFFAIDKVKEFLKDNS